MGQNKTKHKHYACQQWLLFEQTIKVFTKKKNGQLRPRVTCLLKLPHVYALQRKERLEFPLF